jgi:xylulokinase
VARLLGIDIGTSSAKGLLIDESGAILGSATREYPLESPEPGWAQQNPEHWAAAAREILEELGADGLDGIGLAGQMHGSVLVGADGLAAAPALLWCDQRTQAEAAEAEAFAGAADVRRITGNPMLTGFQLPKLLWMRRHWPEAWADARHILLPKDYVRLRLFGELATDVSDASGTGLLDVRTRGWSAELAEAFGIDLDLLPPVLESAAPAGELNGAPVAAGAGDQAGAAIGTGAVKPGVLSVSLGTSGVVFAASDGPPATQVDSVHEFCHAQGGWHRMGVMLSCGSAIAWARDTFFPGESFDAMMTEAEASPAGARGLLFMPHLSGERCPIVDPNLRAGLVGLAVGHTRGDIARAVAEGVCLNLAECQALVAGPEVEKVVITSGAAKSPFFRRMLASVLEAACETQMTEEGPSFGAALLGGVAAGVWSTAAEASAAAVRARDLTTPEQGFFGPEVRERAFHLRRSGFLSSP